MYLAKKIYANDKTFVLLINQTSNLNIYPISFHALVWNNININKLLIFNTITIYCLLVSFINFNQTLPFSINL